MGQSPENTPENAYDIAKNSWINRSRELANLSTNDFEEERAWNGLADYLEGKNANHGDALFMLQRAYSDTLAQVKVLDELSKDPSLGSLDTLRNKQDELKRLSTSASGLSGMIEDRVGPVASVLSMKSDIKIAMGGKPFS